MIDRVYFFGRSIDAENAFPRFFTRPIYLTCSPWSEYAVIGEVFERARRQASNEGSERAVWIGFRVRAPASSGCFDTRRPRSKAVAPILVDSIVKYRCYIDKDEQSKTRAIQTRTEACVAVKSKRRTCVVLLFGM